jgi:D-alanyl-lipoteichoic acid acyltransferase DltB (MBOAT superfamily)
MIPRSADTDDTRWLKLLSRLALLLGVFTIGVFVIFFLGVMPAGVDATLGDDYTMLVAAMHAPALFHVAHLFDALSWLISIGFWLTFALLAARRAPARSALLVAIGCAMVVGLAGVFIRGMGTSAIAESRHVSCSSDSSSSRLG